MTRVINISEAASLALHTMGLLAQNPQTPVSTQFLAESLHASANHLAKVMQRLTRADLVRSVRGPKGGFVLAVDPDQTTMLDVFEAIDGPIARQVCLFAKPVCHEGRCILGGLLDKATEEIRQRLSETRLSDFLQSFEKGNTI